jgi:hypothetical protein
MILLSTTALAVRQKNSSPGAYKKVTVAVFYAHPTFVYIPLKIEFSDKSRDFGFQIRGASETGHTQ